LCNDVLRPNAGVSLFFSYFFLLERLNPPVHILSLSIPRFSPFLLLLFFFLSILRYAEKMEQSCVEDLKKNEIKKAF